MNFGDFTPDDKLFIELECTYVRVCGSYFDVTTAVNRVMYVPTKSENGEAIISVFVIGDNNPTEIIFTKITVEITAFNNFPEFYYENIRIDDMNFDTENDDETNENENENENETENDDYFLPVLALKMIEEENKNIFMNITVKDSDTNLLNLKVTLSRGFFGVNLINKKSKSNEIEINSNPEDISNSLQSLLFTAPSLGTFLNIVRTFFHFLLSLFCLLIFLFVFLIVRISVIFL